MAQALAKRIDTPSLVSDFLSGLQEPRTPTSPRPASRNGQGCPRRGWPSSPESTATPVRVNPASEVLQDRLREMIRIIASAVELTGDVEKALYWFRNEPIADYRHQTALDLVSRGQAEAVLTHLEDLKNGAAG